MKEEMFHLPEGICIVRRPETLSPASVDELEERLALMIKGLKRAAALPKPAEASKK